MTFINTPEDIQWLRDVYQFIPANTKAAILSDEMNMWKIEVYPTREPLYTDIPTVYVRNDDGEFAVIDCQLAPKTYAEYIGLPIRV